MEELTKTCRNIPKASTDPMSRFPFGYTVSHMIEFDNLRSKNTYYRL